MKNIARVAIPLLAGGALLSFASAGVSAATPHQSQQAGKVMAAATYTRGFDVVNKTQYPMRLSDVINPGEGDAAPGIGTILQPGQSVHYEKVWWFAKYSSTELNFTFQKKEGNSVLIWGFQAKVVVDGLGMAALQVPAEYRDMGLVKVDKSVISTTSVTLVDSKPSTVVVGAADKQKQAELLNALCSSSVACTFERTKTAAAPNQVQVAVSGRNDATTAYTFKRTVSANAATKSSVELSANSSFDILKLVSVTLGTKYTNEVTEGRTVTNEMTVTANPKSIWRITSSTPMVREYGTFKARVGNTTFELRDVYFDIPKPGAAVDWGFAQDPIPAPVKKAVAK